VEDGHGALIAEYYYDPFGRRLWKDVDGGRLYFVYSDEGLVGELDQDSSMVREYGFRPNSLWTTDPLFKRYNDSYYFYQNDHIGTPQRIISTYGALAWSAVYVSFGEVIVDKNHNMINNLRFGGQYFDYENRMCYNYYRYYNFIIGRYLRPDPIKFAGGVNFYTFVDNRPTRLIDPNGLFSLGGGGYFGGGAEFSYTNKTCCENDKKYDVSILTVCGGVGLAISGKIPFSPSSSAGGISSRTGCPKTRYYVKHENTLFFRSVNVQLDAGGASAGIDVGAYGIGTAWVFCSDTVLESKLLGTCCADNQ
jgi:RHS repeat-associated protein